MKEALCLLNLPYLWGGKGLPNEAYLGRDCSGTVTSALFAAGGPDWRNTKNTGALYTELPSCDGLLPGDLCLYAHPTGAIHHVMTRLGVGELVFGAAGGDETTIAYNIALKQKARVMIWPTKDYMGGFAGFRRIPWLDEA